MTKEKFLEIQSEVLFGGNRNYMSRNFENNDICFA